MKGLFQLTFIMLQKHIIINTISKEKKKKKKKKISISIVGFV